MFKIVRKLLILIACLVMIVFISACTGKGKSPDNIAPIPINELVTDDYLTYWKGRALEYFQLPNNIKIGWYDLNKNPHPDGLIWGTFHGVIPTNESYISIDLSLKGEHNHYNRLYVIGHETCHYGQWLNGVKFDQGFLKWDERWYEIECIAKGNMFLQEMVSEEYSK